MHSLVIMLYSPPQNQLEREAMDTVGLVQRPHVDTSVARQQAVIARVERLPFHSWHVKVRLFIGVATFFDAFDAIMLAYTLPVLVPLWHIPRSRIGLVISAGYIGQLLGAIFFGWFAERYGRIRSLTVSVVLLSLSSLACVLSPSFGVFFVFRTIQGFGLGGEVPVAAAYINEVSRARNRGAFFCLYECLFTIGLVAAAGIGMAVVPRYGWQAMFLIGTIPALMVPLYIRSIPESPRWLAGKGRLDEAEKVLDKLETITTNNDPARLPALDLTKIEKVKEGRTKVQELFQGIYLQRTIAVWLLWFCAYFVNYGLTIWIPTLFTTVFKVPLPQALRYSFIAQFSGLVLCIICAFTIDIVGRKAWLAISFIGAFIPLLVLGARGVHSGYELAVLYTIYFTLLSPSNMMLYLYTPEIYPTRMRALGCSLATSWLRIASIISPMVVTVLVTYSVSTVFVVMAAAPFLGAIVTLGFAVETKGKVLEELAP
jgi:putative MFS transporter